MLLIRKAETPGDFTAVHSLIAEMGTWDAEEVKRLGLPSDNVIPTYYADNADAVRRRFTHARAVMLLGTDDGVPIGIAGFVGEGTVAEVEKVFVRPGARGRGVGRALMAALMREIEARGFHRARLVTTEFMATALDLYARCGFQRCASFAPAPAELVPITVYMERALLQEG